MTVYNLEGGATIRAKINNALSRVFDARDKGAIPGGVSDLSPAIASLLSEAAAYAAATGGVEIFFPPGIYKMDSPVSQVFADGAKVKISANGAVFDGTSVSGSSAGDTTLITIGGQRTASSSLLSANASKGATSFSTASSLPVAAGQYVLLTSTDLFNPTRAYYFKGEIVKVLSVSGSTISATKPLYDSYTAATTTAHVLQMPSVEIDGGTVIMNANQIALAVEYVQSPLIRRVHCEGARYTGLRVDYFYGGEVSNCTGRDAWYSGTTTSYNLNIGTGQFLSARKNDFSEARHCISLGNNETTRHITISKNTATCHPDEPKLIALDAHGNTQFCTFEENEAEGVVISGADHIIRNNKLFGDKDYALIRLFLEISSEYFEIHGNTGENLHASGDAIAITPAANGLSIDRLDISGNKMKANLNGLEIVPQSSSVTGFSIGSLKIDDNYFQTATAQALAIKPNGAATFTVGSISSKGNRWKTTGFDAAFVSPGGAVGKVTSVMDTYEGQRAAGYPAYFKCSEIRLAFPRFDGGTGSRSVYYDVVGKIMVAYADYANLTYKAEIGGGTEYAEIGYPSASPAVLNTASATLVTSYKQDGTALT